MVSACSKARQSSRITPLLPPASPTKPFFIAALHRVTEPLLNVNVSAVLQQVGQSRRLIRDLFDSVLSADPSRKNIKPTQ